MALKIPLALDERVIDHHIPTMPGQTPRVDDDVVTLRDALKAAREEANNIVALESAMTNDRTRQTGEAALLVADAAKRSGARIVERLDAARARVVTAIERLDKLTAAPPMPINNQEIADEVEMRTTLKAMTDKERDDVINDAFISGKTHIIAAILHKDAFMSGLKPARQAALRHRYQQQFHASDVVRRARLAKQLEAFDRAGTAFTRLINEASDSPAIHLQAANKRAADEALAVLMQRT